MMGNEQPQHRARLCRRKAQPAMQARVNMIRHNSRTRPGGGPHTLKCSVCHTLLNEGEHIDTGTRVRDTDVIWTGPDSPSYAFKLTYRHLDCNYPYGRYAVGTTPTTQEVVVNSNGNDGWNRTPTTTTTTLDDNTATTTTDETALVAKIVAAINKTLMPQLETAFDEFDSKIKANQTETRDLLADAATALNALTQRVTALEANQPTIITVTMPDGTTLETEIDRQHSHFPELLALIKAGAKNIFINGPKGGGKSTAVKMVAKALNYTFELIEMISEPGDLFGYKNVTGDYIPSNFYRAYTSQTPTIICLDEIDGWDARAGLAANPALANGVCAFPHGTHERGPNVIIIACANTWGTGATAEFVGRNKLDDTTLDRFRTQDWPYDEAFEKYLAGYNTGNATADAFIDACITVRHKAITMQERVAISPRPLIEGATLIRNGLSPAATVKACFSRERAHDMWPSVGKALEDFANS